MSHTRVKQARSMGLVGLLMTGLVTAAALITPGAAQAAPTQIKISSQVSAMTGAASDSSQGAYWVVEKSGVAHQVSPNGAVGATVTLSTAPQDVQAASFTGGHLYLGDIGDPSASRSHITVYEPLSLTSSAKVGYHAWDFAYPDGAAHDAATMMISPKGNLYIVTRGANAAIYRGATPWSTTRTNTLTQVATAPAWATDGTFLDAGTVAIRTYNSVHIMNAYTWKDEAQAPISGESNGEAITTQLGSTSTLVTGSGATLTSMSLPTSMASIPAAPSAAPGTASATSKPSSSASRSASSSPSATASSSADDDSSDAAPTDQQAKKRTGTLAALMIAAAMALAAAGFVAWRR